MKKYKLIKEIHIQPVGLPLFAGAKISLLYDGKMGANQGRADRISTAMQYQGNII